MTRSLGSAGHFWGSLASFHMGHLTWRQAPEVSGDGCSSVEGRESNRLLEVPPKSPWVKCPQVKCPPKSPQVKCPPRSTQVKCPPRVAGLSVPLKSSPWLSTMS